MELRQLFLEQLELEAASARKTVERVPEGRNSWKPHERSMEPKVPAIYGPSADEWH